MRHSTQGIVLRQCDYRPARVLLHPSEEQEAEHGGYVQGAAEVACMVQQANLWCTDRFGSDQVREDQQVWDF